MKFDVKLPSISLSEINFSPKEQFEKIWDSVDSYITPRLMSALDKGLASENVLNTLFQGAYEALPLPIRLLMPQDKFMGYCEQKREYFHQKVKTRKGEEIPQIEIKPTPIVNEESKTS